MPDSADLAVLTIGATHVTIKRRGRSEVVTAAILGRESAADAEHVWLDRVVHTGAVERFADGWRGSGPVVTELVHAGADGR